MKKASTTYYASTFDTPCGPFSVGVNDAGAVTATAFGDSRRLLERLPNGAALAPDTRKIAAPVEREVREYFAGKRREFSVSLAPEGTEFQKRVWDALVAIPFGETRSYGGLAKDLGNAGASRAIGRANGTNPICLIVPCHRVIGSDGSLTGFAFGEEIKRRLLAHEGALPATLL